MEKQINHKERAHALLSPSSAERWINCPASVMLCRDLPDTTSPYAEEGTKAHELCEMLLNDGDTATLNAALHAAPGEMQEAALNYRDIILAKVSGAMKETPDARVIVEAQLDMREWVPDCWGTGDALIIADDRMEVVDFKYGKGVRVDADHNAQMMLYALGALTTYGAGYLIDRVRMTIVQPRIGNVSEWETTVTALAKWAEETVKPAALSALNGTGRARTGDWCRFCKAKALCPALAGLAHDVVPPSGRAAKEEYAPARLTMAQLARLLPLIELLRPWGKSVEDYCLAQALAGQDVPGYKLVEGRSVRVVTDAGRLAARLIEEGVAPEAVWRPKELRTLTELEKAVGRKAFATLSEGCVAKPPGKPALVPERDKRPAWNPAEADFAGVELKE